MKNTKRGFDLLPVVVTVAVNVWVMMKNLNLHELSQYAGIRWSLSLITPPKALPLIAQVLIGFT